MYAAYKKARERYLEECKRNGNYGNKGLVNGYDDGLINGYDDFGKGKDKQKNDSKPGTPVPAWPTPRPEDKPTPQPRPPSSRRSSGGRRRSRSSTPRQESPKPPAESPKPPKPETPKPETPKPETPKPETPKPETPKPDSPKPDQPEPVPEPDPVDPDDGVPDEDAETYDPDQPDPDSGNETKPLKVKKVFLLPKKNAFLHHTQDYAIVNKPNDQNPQLVVRRGHVVTIKFELSRQLVDSDVMRLVFKYGDKEKRTRFGQGVVQPLELTKSKEEAEEPPAMMAKKKPWKANILKRNGRTLTVVFTPHPNCQIGKWNLEITTSKQKEDGDKPKPQKYVHPHPVYVLFNAWGEVDDCYIPDDPKHILKDEYVLNPSGYIYKGSSFWHRGKIWGFDQFKENILECALYLLDLAKMSYAARGDAAAVARHISSVVNGEDNNGVLVGNWSGDYEDGVPPLDWNSSARILQQFYETKTPVKYGQCWVFSALCTTVCRALGMPARSITNFDSAHDTDGSITIDTYYDKDGNKIENLCTDSVWNFHCWNEVWIKRHDIPHENPDQYNGWQIIDATPQETSDGFYQLGPFPQAACKEGEVWIPNEGPFVFSEVNGDRCEHHAIEAVEDDKWERILKNESVGTLITSSKPRMLVNGDNESAYKDDITLQYKYPEGLPEEREACKRANLCSTREKLAELYDNIKEPASSVKIDVAKVMVGEILPIKAKVKNLEDRECLCAISLALSSVNYTGVRWAPVKTANFEEKFAAQEEKEVLLEVTADEYLANCNKEMFFKIDAFVRELDMADDCELSHISTEHYFYEFNMPELQMKPKGFRTVTVGKEFTTKLKFKNPLPIPMTGIKWFCDPYNIEIVKAIETPDTLEPNGEFEATLVLVSHHPGMDRYCIVSMESMQLADIEKNITVTVDGDGEDDDDDPDEVESEDEVEPDDPDAPDPDPGNESKPLRIKTVNFMQRRNAFLHHTKEYDIAKRPKDENPQLVVRRGQVVKIKCTLSRPLVDSDDVKLIFKYGDKEKKQLGRVAVQRVKLTKSPEEDVEEQPEWRARKKPWEASVLEDKGETLMVGFTPHPATHIGKWSLEIKTKKKKVPTATLR